MKRQKTLFSFAERAATSDRSGSQEGESSTLGLQ